jgi:hypothetical protein
MYIDFILLNNGFIHFINQDTLDHSFYYWILLSKDLPNKNFCVGSFLQNEKLRLKNNLFMETKSNGWNLALLIVLTLKEAVWLVSIVLHFAKYSKSKWK